MKTKKTYRFRYNKNGQILNGMSIGFLPEYAIEVLQEYELLYPEKGMILIDQQTGEKHKSIIISEDFDENRYIEEPFDDKIIIPEFDKIRQF